MIPQTDLRRIGLAAEQIGVDRSTLYRAAKAKKITLIKCGVMTFVDMAEVANWIAPDFKVGAVVGALGGRKA